MIKDIFYELIEEAKNGRVIIEDEEIPIGFNTLILDGNKEILNYDNEINMSKLIIKDEDKFFDVLDEYLSKELSLNRKYPYMIDKSDNNKIKWLIAYLFANATTEDFLNPIEFIKRRSSFLDDDIFSYLNNGEDFDIIPSLLNSNLIIDNSLNSIMMETPYKIEFTLINNIGGKEVSFKLPSIYYGIQDDNGEKTCYIYSIMKPKQKDEDKESIAYGKKINRLLYKLNDGIKNVESEEYFDYKNGNSSYYPEGNISDVTPSFVLSMNMFLNLLQKEGITKVRGVPYLPLRYLSRELAASSVDSDERKKELRERNDNIQSNITNKFIRTIERVSYHMPSINIKSLPYELTEYIEFDVDGSKDNIDNPILNEVSNVIYDKRRKVWK